MTKDNFKNTCASHTNLKYKERLINIKNINILTSYKTTI